MSVSDLTLPALMDLVGVWCGKGGVIPGSVITGSTSSVVVWVDVGFCSVSLAGIGRPIPRITMASLRACIKCFRTSIAAFFLENRICKIASSIDFPAICRANGASFFIDVLKKCDLER